MNGLILFFAVCLAILLLGGSSWKRSNVGEGKEPTSKRPSDCE